jgi:4-hydroxybenzoyl-CoA thioesterase
VTEFRRSSFFVAHKVMKKVGVLALEGLETRLWTTRDPADPKKLKSAPMPPEILAAFQR